MPVYTYLCYTCPQEILTLADRTKQDFLRKKANLEGNHRHQQLWWYQAPYIVETFLESGGFSGKTIVPFVPHGGSGFSRTISTIQSLQPEATVLEDGFSVARSNVATSAQAAMDWASGLNMA